MIRCAIRALLIEDDESFYSPIVKEVFMKNLLMSKPAPASTSCWHESTLSYEDASVTLPTVLSGPTRPSTPSVVA
jgi:hypothetical protein